MADYIQVIDPETGVAGSLDIATPERHPITFNFDGILDAGQNETVETTVSLIEEESGGTAPASIIDGSTAQSGNLVTQWIDAADMQDGESYRLVIIATTSIGRRVSPYLILNAIF